MFCHRGFTWPPFLRLNTFLLPTLIAEGYLMDYCRHPSPWHYQDANFFIWTEAMLQGNQLQVIFSAASTRRSQCLAVHQK
jgi:hypothetical protein